MGIRRLKGFCVNVESPEKRLIQAGRRTRDALRDLRDIVRRERKADLYNQTFARLDEAVEAATDGLIEISSVFEEVLQHKTPSSAEARDTDVMDLHALQDSLSVMKAEREELIESLQGAQQQLQKYADDLQILYAQERQKRAELAVAYERLKQVDQLKADFLSNVNHELSSHLVPVDFSLQLIDKGTLDTDQRDNLQRVRQLLGEHKRKIDGLVNYANLVNQSQVVNPQLIQIENLLTHTLEPIQLLALGRDIQVEIQPIIAGLTLIADPDLVSAAVYQLAHNAIKFNKPGGHVRISVRPERDGLLFSFYDDGLGIPEPILARFGQDFNQIVDALQRGVEGLGLGIALAHYVAEAHHGTLTAQSGQGQGTTVQLWLPQGDL